MNKLWKLHFIHINLTPKLTISKTQDKNIN